MDHVVWEGMWKTSEHKTKKVVECSKWGLMSHISSSSEDSSSESNVGFRDTVQVQY